MARGKRWTEAETKLLMEMVKEDKSVEEIIKSGKFPNRTSMAIQNAVKRFSFDSQKKNFIDSQIRETEIGSFGSQKKNL